MSFFFLISSWLGSSKQSTKKIDDELSLDEREDESRPRMTFGEREREKVNIKNKISSF